MRKRPGLVTAFAFVVAAGACAVAAGYAVTQVEDSTEIGVRRALDAAEFDWAEVEADGLRVIVSGTAPNEATRFEVLSTAGRVVDAARLIDEMDVADAADLAPPKFSVEILRNASGISVIGLIPAATDRESLGDDLARIAGQDEVADFLEASDHPVPEHWDAALDFAVTALRKLPRSKISASPGQVHVTAMTESPEARTRLERELRNNAPDGLNVVLNISAPRPVITPFTLRYVLDANGGRFDACSAPDEASAATILSAARAAGLTEAQRCTIGLGVPSPNWDRAATLALAALPRLGGGTLTMKDTDIVLAAAEPMSANLFDEVVGELENALPAVFSLQAILPIAEDEVTGPAEFYATLSPEGLVQLRGRLPDETVRTLADSFARARFGTGSVHTATRVVKDLPPDWTARSLAALEALGYLVNGVVSVTEETITVQGVTENENATSDISRLFAAKLGEAESFDLSITYREPPPPKDVPLAAEECEQQVEEILATRKITFEPGAAKIDAASLKTVEAIAAVLDRCPGTPLEIQGHTDSQGREVMNLDLSQQRADAVLTELNARRVRTATYRSVGYGETRPIAENDTEEGREANRRIEFRLIRSDVSAEDETTLDSLSAPTDGDDAETEAAPDPDAGEEESANEQN